MPIDVNQADTPARLKKRIEQLERLTGRPLFGQTRPMAESIVWWTVHDVANAFGVSEDTVRRMADLGDLPATRTPSGQRLFRESDVLAVLKRRQSELKTPAAAGRFIQQKVDRMVYDNPKEFELPRDQKRLMRLVKPQIPKAIWELYARGRR